MENKPDDLIWKCLDCDLTGPPTAAEYMKLLKHKKGHRTRLVNKATGEVIAASRLSAIAKGIPMPEQSKTGEKSGESGEKSGEQQGGNKGKTGESDSGMVLTEEGLTLPITLPPVAFAMFDAAKAAELVDAEKDFDSWLFECVMKRFELDYGYNLALVPVKA